MPHKPVKGKGKGAKGKGKGKGPEKTAGKGKLKGSSAEPADLKLKSCRVNLGEESQLTIIKQLSQARGVRLDVSSSDEDDYCEYYPSEEESDSDEEGEEEQGSGDDRDEQDLDCPSKKSGDSPKKQMSKKHFLERLMREDRLVKADTDRSIDSGTTVQLHICEASKIQHKAKKVSYPVRRGGSEELNTLLEYAKKQLGIKGRPLSAYLVGEDGTVSFKLVGTSRLADGQLIAISAKDLGVKTETMLPEPPAENMTVEAGDTVEALDAVRAAYARRATSWTCGSLTEEEQRELSAELAAYARVYASSTKHAAMRVTRAALPAAGARRELAEALEKSQVVIIAGETGSGKTTQCANFILEAASEAGHGGEVSILCTQPRRIAAVAVAERVAEERGEEPGGIVGYAVRMETRVSRRTRLLFCTTGVLMQRLNTSPDLAGITHVIVDEAHERSLHTDFVLSLLREVLELRPDLRLVVMSATLEQGLFERYFRGFAFDPSDDLPVVNIAGRTHPLTVRYLADAQAAAGRQGQAPPAATGSNAGVDSGLEAWVRRVHAVGADAEVIVSPEVKKKADFDLIADLCAAILLGNLGAEANDDGAILVFLPGYAEIDRCIRILKNHPGVGQKAWILPLHGSLPIRQQTAVFNRPPAGTRKIVVSTNIAETSITIDDVTHVVDSGHVRETRYNPQSSMSVFSTVWVSASAAKQRAGRASRTRPGVVWRLYDQVFLDRDLPKHTLCEMRRTALEELVLQLRLLQAVGDPGALLQMAPEPPSPEAVACAVQLLKAIGALGSSPAMPLTPLGFHLAHLPMDARIGKMLVYGALCGCLAPMLTIAACLSHKSLIHRSFNNMKEEEQRRNREGRFGHLCSDHLAHCAAFGEYQAALAKGGREAAWALCDELGLSSSAADGVAQLRQRFLRELIEIGFAEDSGEDGGSRANAHSDNDALVRCMLCAGLFPSVVQVQRHRGAQGKVTLVSREGEQCAIHPMSLNVRQQQNFATEQGWLLFHTKFKTSQIFLQDSTLVGSIPLLLFGGELRTDKSRTHIATGGLSFRARKDTMFLLLRMLRRELDRLLLLKVSDPELDLAASSSALLQSLTRLLDLEDMYAGGFRRK